MDFPEAHKCFEIKSYDDFNEHALKVFQYQSENVTVYHDYLKALNINVKSIDNWKKIPCLPISFFKTHKVIAENKPAELVFTSSGTTGIITSSHFVADLNLYKESFLKGFQYFYADPGDYCILALLPSYLEREGSSLVFMADTLIKKSNHSQSGFYLDQYSDLAEALLTLRNSNQKTILLGVTFALLDLPEKFKTDFPELIVMETGGMKGRRKEMIRKELHENLKAGFNVQKIHSEYGMTELLSQAYSESEGIFKCPPWMKVSIREINDPFAILPENKTGGLNIIDLANVYSCSFIATQDLGKLITENSFEVLGRFDNSDLRGCNLLVQ